MTKQEIGGDVAGNVIGGDAITHKAKVAINGNVGHVTVGEVIHIHYAQPPAVIVKPRITMQPSAEHLDDVKKASLKALVDDVVRLEAHARRTPKTHAAVWGALNKRMKATSYHLIRAEDFTRAEKFLREWVGRLSSTKSATKSDPDWRKRKYAYIFTNIKQLGAEAKLETLLRDEYAVESLKGLDDSQLTAVYQRVAGWKRTGTARRATSPGAA